MTISQELIEQTKQQKQDIKFIHIKKEDLLCDYQHVTLDGLTFNGKNHLWVGVETSAINKDGPVSFWEYVDRSFKFDGISVAYTEDNNGDLAICFVLKSPKDQYNKRVGNNLTSVALLSYLGTSPTHELSMYSPYEYVTFVKTISITNLVNEDEFAMPYGYLQTVGVSALRNAYVMQRVKEEIEHFLIRYVQHYKRFTWINEHQ
ncbi:MAG TPA: hypothetical protein VFM18_00815 [Methanosarcina sp.]|nr:hypothetical protein [Methanosarcina sp.]